MGNPVKPVFISYATSDRNEALKVCDAIERRGVRCWIASRDVEPGENYQEAIVRAIRNARALVLVFSDRANNSDEIKKELSLVSRFRVPLIALRVEDVEPSDAFAYELSTRQWIDLFEDWDKSIDALVRRVGSIAGEDGDAAIPTQAVPASPKSQPSPPTVAPPAPRRSRLREFRSLGAGLAALLLLIAVGAIWFWFRPTPPAEHPMEVRLADFKRVSNDLPETMPDAMREEIIATFAHDGLIGISTARAARPGTAPAYALSETVSHEGDKIRIIATLINERSGATLWSNSFSYGAKQADRVPRFAALDISDTVRTGLFAASTYPKALPDAALGLYFQSLSAESSTKSLDLARKIVAEVPDFSWGWSAVTLMAESAAVEGDVGADEAARLYDEAMRAADKAIAIDPTNSEALTAKAMLLPADQLAAREALYKQAMTARPLACGCEHHEYGLMLTELGRTHDAIRELRRSIDVMPLNPGTQGALGMLLAASGDPSGAKQAFDAYVDVSPAPTAKSNIKIRSAFATHDWAGALAALDDPDYALPPAAKAAWAAGFRALAANNAAAKAAAVPALLPLTKNYRLINMSLPMLGALGAYAQTFTILEDRTRPDAIYHRYLLFMPGMEGAVRDPGFPAFAETMGLTRYWRESHIKPDFCQASDAPAYCNTL